MAWITYWAVKTVSVQPGVINDKYNLEEALKDFWEPFAVTWGDGRFVYHLRKWTEEKEKK